MKELMKKFLRTNKNFFYCFTVFLFAWNTIASDKKSGDDLCIFRIGVSCYFHIFFYFLSTNIGIFFSKIGVNDDFTFFVDELFNDNVGSGSSKTKVTTKNIVKNLIFEFFCKS